jgi:hypothetical protein
MIRAKITPTPTAEGNTNVRIDWIEILPGEQPGAVKFSEEFQLSPQRSGSSYVSRLCVDQHHEQLGTFWLDEAGRRHLVMVAEPGNMQAVGQATALLAVAESTL